MLGKLVVTTDAMVLGTVNDIAVSSEGKIALQIDAKSNDQSKAAETQDETFINSDEIQAVGDVVLLKYPSKRSPSVSAQSSTSTTYPSSFTSTPVASPIPPPPNPAGSFSGAKLCPRCGYSNSTTSRFCIKCGSSIS